MPVYEYQCKACEREFEYQQRMSDPDKTLCEACGKEALERIISRTAFQLKGGGWYKDLYASTKPEAAKSEGGGTAAAATPAAPAAGAAAPAAPASTASTPAAPSSSGSGSSGGSGGGSSGSSSSSGGSSSGSGGGGSSGSGGGKSSSGGGTTK